MGDLSGNIALVTGSTKGLGAAVAQLLVRDGATVVISGLNDIDGHRYAEEINSNYVRLDVTSESDWEEGLLSIVEEFGRLDILINNAGVVHRERIEDHRTGDWLRVIATNQTGVFLGMRAAARQMVKQRRGSIVNVASVAVHDCAEGSIAYTASKCAVVGMTKVAARELGPSGIRVNALLPGLMNTQMADELDPDGSGRERLVKQIPLRRAGATSEVAELAVFLASDASSYCTGGLFQVDGGASK